MKERKPATFGQQLNSLMKLDGTFVQEVEQEKKQEPFPFNAIQDYSEDLLNQSDRQILMNAAKSSSWGVDKGLVDLSSISVPSFEKKEE